MTWNGTVTVTFTYAAFGKDRQLTLESVASAMDVQV